MSKKEIFYNFIDEKSKKYFLWVTWSDGDAFYLRLVLSDCMNYWSGKCKFYHKNLFKSVFKYFILNKQHYFL